MTKRSIFVVPSIAILLAGCDGDLKTNAKNFINEVVLVAEKEVNKGLAKAKKAVIDSVSKTTVGGSSPKPKGIEKHIQKVPEGSYIFPINLETIYGSSKCSKVIKKSMFSTCYSYKYKSALLNSFVIDGKLVDEVNIKNRPNFYPSYELPKKYRSVYKDFSGNDIDRGHLRSDASSDWEHAELKQTYSLMNVVPQYSVLNRKIWIKAEKYSRMISRKLGKAYVINIVEFDENPEKMGKNQISIPSGFYKIVYNNEPQRDTIFRKCFYYGNKKYTYDFAKNDKLKNHIVDCSKIVF